MFTGVHVYVKLVIHCNASSFWIHAPMDLCTLFSKNLSIAAPHFHCIQTGESESKYILTFILALNIVFTIQSSSCSSIIHVVFLQSCQYSQKVVSFYKWLLWAPDWLLWFSSIIRSSLVISHEVPLPLATEFFYAGGDALQRCIESCTLVSVHADTIHCSICQLLLQVLQETYGRGEKLEAI